MHRFQDSKAAEPLKRSCGETMHNDTHCCTYVPICDSHPSSQLSIKTGLLKATRAFPQSGGTSVTFHPKLLCSQGKNKTLHPVVPTAFCEVLHLSVVIDLTRQENQIFFLFKNLLIHSWRHVLFKKSRIWADAVFKTIVHFQPAYSPGPFIFNAAFLLN